MKFIAIDGDLSANGMSDVATEIDVSPFYAKQILLWSELNDQLARAFDDASDGQSLVAAVKSIKAKQEPVEEKLRAVFTSKWHYRTTWAKVVEPTKAQLAAMTEEELNAACPI